MRAHRIVLFAVVLAPLGCIEQRPAINRVQPDYLDKRDFIPNQYAALTAGGTPQTLTPTLIAKEPVFYTQTTMIAKPTTTGFTGLTRYSEADKIRWEVTETTLIARQSYEFVKGAPTGGAGIGNVLQSGDPIAIFKIASHFDIKNAYNTTTGETLNVVEENTTDRPWYMRRYMRVDWSANLIDGYNSVLDEAIQNGQIVSTPIPYFINTPDDPNAPVFQWSGSDANRKLVYFDIVNQATLHPETTMYSYIDRPGSTTSIPKLPVCYLSENSTDCAPATVTFRVAFRRSDPQRDYEPAPVNVPIPNITGGSQPLFQHLDMERFGFFDQARVGYDPVQHATLNNQRMHFASRHNLWVHHHVLNFGDDSGKGCNRDEDCTTGSACHIGNTAIDSSHRGYCAKVLPAHDASDLDCTTDDDCVQTINGGGQSNTAFCDKATKTCAENYIRCGADADCAKLDPNSTCDLATAYNRADNRGLCLLPFLQRQVRPVAYHESGAGTPKDQYPDYMQAVTESMVREWNSAFVKAVVGARRHECELNKKLDPAAMMPGQNPCDNPMITGRDPSVAGFDTNLSHDAQFPFVGCHSPVWGTDPKMASSYHSQDEVDAAHAKGWDLYACDPPGDKHAAYPYGVQGTVARIGDLRYSMIGAITDHDQQGYWGLANIAGDPETGEMVAGRGAVWQTITDTQANYALTLIKVLSGNLDPGSVSNGDYILSAQKQLATGATPASEVIDAPLREAGSLERIGAMQTGLDRLVLPDRGWFHPEKGAVLFTYDNRSTNRGAMDQVDSRLFGSRLLGDGTAAATKRLLSLAGTPLEGRLMNTQQALLATGATADPGGTLPETLNEASPVRMQSLAMKRAVEAARTKFAAYECEYDAMFSDDMLLQLAQRLAGGAPIDPANADDEPVAFGRVWDFTKDVPGGRDPNVPERAYNWTLMGEYLANFIHHGVLAHEVGHSLGQRHNFAASADAINYFDQYWLVRSKGHPTNPADSMPGLRPRYQYLADKNDGHYYSAEEIAGRVDEWSYSSVMDYKGLNEDAHGIGRYDVAFIKNGYTGTVEAFKSVPDPALAAIYGENMGGTGLSTTLDLRNGVKGVHYTQIPAVYGMTMGADGQTMVPNIRDDNRYDVFLRETCGLAGNPNCSPITGLGSTRFSNATVATDVSDAHVLVPYRFDTDGRAGLIWQVQRYDAGADAFESLHYVTERVLNYYFANSYARMRTGFSTKKYVDRIWGRYLEQLHQCTQTLAYDIVRFADFFPANQYKPYLSDPLGGLVNKVTMNMSADTHIALLTMPEMGYHNVVPQFDNSQVVQPISFGSYLTVIPVNEGRLFESQWRNDVGYWWYEMLDSAGSYYDKAMSIQSLTDPELHLLQRDTPTDIRQFELSFYTMYPDQMLHLFGGIVSEDYADFAPIVDLNNTTQHDIAIKRTQLATLNLPPGSGANQSGRVINSRNVPIDPQDHFTIQLWAIVHAMAQFPATYDQRYADYARMWIDGSVEAIDVQDPATNTVSFTDPWSHSTYRALHFGAKKGEAGETVGASASVHLATGKAANEAGVAARAILHLQDLDTARLAAVATGNADTINVATTVEQKYIDVIHAMRDVTAQFGHGYSSTP